jgi:hypothetical protein
LIATISAWDVWRNYHVHRSLFVYGQHRGILIPQPLPRSSYLDYINWQLSQPLPPLPTAVVVPVPVVEDASSKSEWEKQKQQRAAEHRIYERHKDDTKRQHHRTQLLLQHAILSTQRDYIHQLTAHHIVATSPSGSSSSSSTSEVKKKDVSYGITFARAIHDIHMVFFFYISSALLPHDSPSLTLYTNIIIDSFPCQANISLIGLNTNTNTNNAH